MNAPEDSPRSPVILSSLETISRLQPGGPGDERVPYYVVRLHDAAQLPEARSRLAAAGREHGFEVWTRKEFAKSASDYWLLDTGAGLGVLFLAVVVSLVGAVITSQTLMGAVAGSATEYAALQALGIGVRALRGVVLEQAETQGSMVDPRFWIRQIPYYPTVALSTFDRIFFVNIQGSQLPCDLL